jgi:hypothetical protein
MEILTVASFVVTYKPRFLLSWHEIKNAKQIRYAADNPEVLAAHQAHIPVIQRAEMLAELMRFRRGRAIAGTRWQQVEQPLLLPLPSYLLPVRPPAPAGRLLLDNQPSHHHPFARGPVVCIASAATEELP